MESVTEGRTGREMSMGALDSRLSPRAARFSRPEQTELGLLLFGGDLILAFLSWLAAALGYNYVYDILVSRQ